jgi:hypothetical protein
MWLIEKIKNSPPAAENKLLRISQWYRHNDENLRLARGCGHGQRYPPKRYPTSLKMVFHRLFHQPEYCQ